MQINGKLLSQVVVLFAHLAVPVCAEFPPTLATPDEEDVKAVQAMPAAAPDQRVALPVPRPDQYVAVPENPLAADQLKSS